MQDIEPYYKWRELYVAADDEHSPFHGRVYNEFSYTKKIYNYFIHPQWDEFGSSTLYVKILMVDYIERFAIIELIGEWNDCINNDIALFKRNLIDYVNDQEINKYVLLCDNVLNFHSSDECYYEEWQEEVIEDGGWICLVNLQEHVMHEMKRANLNFYMNFGMAFNHMLWQKYNPKSLLMNVEHLIEQSVKQLH